MKKKTLDLEEGNNPRLRREEFIDDVKEGKVGAITDNKSQFRRVGC
jgi:hypothetical protein